MVVFLLFIIACAVAPEAIINICRFVEWCVKVLFYTASALVCVGFFWYAGVTVYEKLAA